MTEYCFKGLYKTNCYKTNSNFCQFSFLIDCCMSVFFSFLIKAFVNFEKLIRFHRQAFVVHKNEENLKIVMEIFLQKLLVSNVFLAFSDHLKPKLIFVRQPVVDIERLPFSKFHEPPLTSGPILDTYCGRYPHAMFFLNIIWYSLTPKTLNSDAA